MARILKLLGTVYYFKGDYNEAIAVFQEAVEQGLFDYLLLNNYAAVLFISGDKRDARMVMEQALKLDPENIAVLENLKLIYKELDLKSEEAFIEIRIKSIKKSKNIEQHSLSDKEFLWLNRILNDLRIKQLPETGEKKEIEK